MNEDQKTTNTVPVKATEVVKPQAVQPTATVKEPDTVKPQPTAPAKATEPIVPQPKQPTVQAPEPVKPQPTQPTAPTPTKVAEPVVPQPKQPVKVPKLSDVVPTSKVWISGLIGNRQIDCLGPIEIPLKIDEPTYPFTPVASNPNYTNQVFDYDTGEWVATDAKSQGQMLTDLTNEVADLQQAITKHDKDAEQSQAMVMQQMQTLMSINSKLDVLTKKDGVK